jgi:hypothetical protein
VQGVSSLHWLPVLGGFEHEPLAGSHTPAPRHWSAAGQVTGLPPLQVPPWQASVRVQALPSLQPEPSVLEGLEQTPVMGLQAPALWH